MIETFAPDRTDDALDVRRLPGRPRCGQHFRDPHASQALPRGPPIDAAAIADHVARRRIPWKGLGDLLGDPDRRWVFRDTELHDPATVMAQDDEAVQQPERCGRDNKEIHRRQATDMVFEEPAPRLRWRFGMAKDVSAYTTQRGLRLRWGVPKGAKLRISAANSIRRLVMGVAIALRGDFDGPGLRRLAEAAKDAGQSRRGLALGDIYDGGARSDAARMSGVGLSGDPGLGGCVSMPMVRTGRLTARHRARRPSSTTRNAERLHGSSGTGRSRRPMA